MPSKVAELLERQKKLDEKIDSVTRGKNPNPDTPTKEQVFGVPFARKGEDMMGSRGFSYARLLGRMYGVLQPEHAKVELELSERLRKSFLSTGGYEPLPNTILAPFGVDYFPDDLIDNAFRYEMKSLTFAGVAGLDTQEVSWLRTKAYTDYSKKTQSWLDETLGGALVAPPEMGELIQLLRNKDALVNAGARIVPMPPQGRLKVPRQTAATVGYWVGEKVQIPESQFKTGALNLSSKKAATLVTTPNELLRYASPAVEALVRADMTKTLSLTIDKGLLDGGGGDNVPLGLINTPNIATVTPKTVGANGNKLAPQDVYSFISAIQANNAEMEGWIIRPELWAAMLAYRATVLTAGDNLGLFLFDITRGVGQGAPDRLAGHPVTVTNQVSNARKKGSGNNLTYLAAGQWRDFLMAVFGAIEFAQATQGDSLFAYDQTFIRAILAADGGPRHPGAFAVADQLLMAVGDS